MRDLPDVLQEIQAVVYDFNTGEELAGGFANIKFVVHTDRLRVMRNLFEGMFVPATAEGAQALRRKLFMGLSQGAPALSMHVEHEGETWVFVVKFEVDEIAFPFAGRAEPKRL
jgi:hypothetical protein